MFFFPCSSFPFPLLFTPLLVHRCDGLEWEQSQNILDLRYIPDDTEFDEEPKDVCVEMPSEHEFNPEPFETKALGHTKVGLSWDEEDKDDNLRLTKRKFNKQELENMDYSAYLASDTDDSLSEDEDGGGDGFNVELETIDQVDQDKLRAYEIAKLKYYYAVVEVDSVETAIAIYTG